MLQDKVAGCDAVQKIGHKHKCTPLATHVHEAMRLGNMHDAQHLLLVSHSHTGRYDDDKLSVRSIVIYQGGNDDT